MLRIPRCQEANRPTRKPRRKNNEKAATAPAVLLVPLGSQEPLTAKANAKPLLLRARPRVKKTRANREERSPHRTFRKPRTAVSFIFSLLVMASEKKHVIVRACREETLKLVGYTA